MTTTVLVAIPVKNEVERIANCLRALAAQRPLDGGTFPSFGVILFVNNSDDGTAEMARSLAPSLPYPLTVLTATLEGVEASAGGARRRAMDAAATALAGCTGQAVLMTTDADSRVAPDWIARNVAAIAAGAAAVAGTVELDADDEAALPAALKRRGALEARYEALVCELETRLNPQPGDPWPRHPTESGASLAVTLEAYTAVGGVPLMALGEDRALIGALRDAGFRIRHAPEITVVTSGRLFGRAAGGCADTMRLRIEQPAALCDTYLRPVTAILRATPAAAPLRPDELRFQIVLAGLALALVRLGGRLHAFRQWFQSARKPLPTSAGLSPETGGAAAP